MFGMRSMWKTGLLAAMGLMLASGVALGGPLGLRLGGVGVLPYGGFGYYYPGYYASPFAYGFYGPGYGYSVRYGYGVYGMRMGYGLGYGGMGAAYGGMGYGFGLGTPGVGFGNPLMQQRGQPGAMPQAPLPQRVRRGQIPQPTPVPPDEEEKQAPVEDNTARVTVVVPERAELWFNDAKTNQTGKRREFATAPLTPGKDFRYRIKARWIENGKPVQITHTIKVRANSAQTVDFIKMQNAPVPE
ncbi:MAG: TIGR03000 domain-containing protein [Gemmataceae bacterium]